MFSFYCFHIFLVKVSNPFFWIGYIFFFGFGFWLSERNGFIFCILFCFFLCICAFIGFLYRSPHYFLCWHPPFYLVFDQFIFYCHPYDTIVWFLLVLLLSPLLLLLLLLLVVSRRPLLFVRTCKTC